MMNISLSTTERNLVVRALTILAEEYHTLADSSVSILLSRGFKQDAIDISTLSERFAALREQASEYELIATVKNLMASGQKINAIRYVRENRFMGLKEAKDYVESIA